MNHIAKVISLISLGLVVFPCGVYFAGALDLNTVKLLALIGTLGWFGATPWWMGRDLSIDAGEVEI